MAESRRQNVKSRLAREVFWDDKKAARGSGANATEVAGRVTVMNVILALLLVGIVVAYVKRGQLGEKANLVLGILVALALLGVVVRAVSGGGKKSAAAVVSEQIAFYRVAGAKLGAAIAAAHPGGGTVLVLRGAETVEDLKKIAQARLEGLKQGLGSGYRVVEATPPEEPGSEEMYSIEMILPMRLFLKMVETAPDAKAVVSLLGAPAFARGPLPKYPPLYLFEMVDPGMAKDLMGAGAIWGAVLFKDDADWKAKPRRDMSDDEIFNLRYTLVTAAR